MRIQSTLKTNLVILACMITALFLSTGYAQTSPENLVRLWIKQSLRVDTFRITWVEGHEIKGKDGQIMGAFDLRQTCEYRWPIEMRIETRAIPTGHRHDSARAMQFDRESKIDASGEQTEAPLRSSNSRSLGTDRSLKGGVQYQALRAPHLIGIWLADHQEITSTAQRNADKTVSFTIEPLRLRVMLSENPDTSGHLHPLREPPGPGRSVRNTPQAPRQPIPRIPCIPRIGLDEQCGYRIERWRWRPRLGFELDATSRQRTQRQRLQEKADDLDCAGPARRRHRRRGLGTAIKAIK